MTSIPVTFRNSKRSQEETLNINIDNVLNGSYVLSFSFIHPHLHNISPTDDTVESGLYTS